MQCRLWDIYFYIMNIHDAEKNYGFILFERLICLLEK